MSERRAETKPSTLRVKLRYPDVDTFLAKYGPNISRGGVFIATKTPRAVGTSMRFEFVLVNADKETPVFRGEGVVHFVRDAEQAGPQKPAGMGVKFTRLSDEAQALVERVLGARAAAANPNAPPEPTGPVPAQVREVTGEVEIVTGPVPKLDAIPRDVPLPDAPSPPDTYATLPENTLNEAIPTQRRLETLTEDTASTSTADVDALLDESGVSRERVDAVLREARAHLNAEAAEQELSALLNKSSDESTTKAQALEGLEQLLRRR